jgi:hypothetical protein
LFIAGVQAGKKDEIYRSNRYKSEFVSTPGAIEFAAQYSSVACDQKSGAR